MRQKQTFKKAFAYSIFLLVVYTLQITMLARIRIEDVSALIIPLAVVGAGSLRRRPVGRPVWARRRSFLRHCRRQLFVPIHRIPAHSRILHRIFI